MSADAAADAADADAAAERRLNHSIPRTYFVRGIQLKQHLGICNWLVPRNRCLSVVKLFYFNIYIYVLKGK